MTLRHLSKDPGIGKRGEATYRYSDGSVSRTRLGNFYLAVRETRRYLQNNYDSSLFPSAIVRSGPVKGGPNFEIHCAPLYAAALISGVRRRWGAYDALKMNKTGRLNIRRAAVQKFTSAEREKTTQTTTHTQTCATERERVQGEGGIKGGGRRERERKREKTKERARERERKSRESIEPT